MNEDGKHSYENALTEFYRGEVGGEAFMSALFEAASDPVERLKLAHLLQLETETKAWLRPHLLRAGMNIAETQALRDSVVEFVRPFASQTWPEKMRAFLGILPEVVKQYRAFAEAARSRGRADQAAVCEFMVDHELAQVEFARLDLEGAELAVSLEPLLRQSRYPLPVDI